MTGLVNTRCGFSCLRERQLWAGRDATRPAERAISIQTVGGDLSQTGPAFAPITDPRDVESG